MEFRGLHLFYLIITLRQICGESLYYKQPKDNDPSKDIRGHSFGLENFLLQAYKDVDTFNDEQPAKRTRGRETYKSTELANVRGQTFGLENLAPSLYDLGHPSLGLSEYLDIKPITDPKQNQKRRIPENQFNKNSDSDERRDRNKIRKPVKQVVRRPLTSTAAPTTTTERVIKEEIAIQNKEPTPVPELKFTAEEALTENDIPKVQETTLPEKENDHKQRPRKRITMRRRRKRPQNSQDSEKATQINDSRPAEDVKEVYEIQKDDFPPQTTVRNNISTSTIKARTDKERPNRKRPAGFRKAEEKDQDSSKADSTTVEYQNDSESSETSIITTYAPDIREYNDEPFTKHETTTTSSTTSSEETSAADLKTILKQQNGPLSLSELLQTQNLSLADFLKNRKEAALLLSGKRIQSTTSRTDSRELNRPSSFNTKGRPFTRNRQETSQEETRSSERNRIVEATTISSDRYTYNGFVPKNPRGRQGYLKTAVPTVKSNFASDEKKTAQEVETSTNSIETPQTSLRPRLHLKNLPKRFNDVRLKLRIHRRKYNPNATANGSENNTTTTSTTTTTITTPIIEKITTTEDAPTTKRIGLRIPFKSSNNPELSLILPSRNKSEEKKERNSNNTVRIKPLKKSSQENYDTKSQETNDVEQTTTSKSTVSLTKEENLPLDVIDMEDEKEIFHEESIEDKDKTDRVEAVGKIPSVNENEKYESKDEILELLKPGSNSERLKRILQSRNMTVKELLENREKSSLQSNFTQLFKENEVARIDIKTTTDANPDFKIFKSLPDFQPIHRNLFQKNVKEIKSNSYPDSQVDETRPAPSHKRINATESRGSKHLSNVVEVKKKLQLNSDSEGRDSFEGNDGLLERWNAKDKILFYNDALSKLTVQTVPTIKSNIEKFSVEDKTEKELEESDIILLETIKRSQDGNQKLKSNINEILQEQSEVREIHSDIDKSFIPPAVKSAIIASGVVMGLALFVFVAIFAACGWKQRHIRLRARSSILNDALAKSDSEKKVQRTSALSPQNFKQSSVYKKSTAMDDTSSGGSLSSNASSYLWNTLKNTFVGRSTTLKNRLEKDEKIREERLEGLKSVLRSPDSRRSDLLVEDDPIEETFSNPMRRQEERYSIRQSDRIKRSPSFSGGNHFSSCTHGH